VQLDRLGTDMKIKTLNFAQAFVTSFTIETELCQTIYSPEIYQRILSYADMNAVVDDGNFVNDIVNPLCDIKLFMDSRNIANDDVCELYIMIKNKNHNYLTFDVRLGIRGIRGFADNGEGYKFTENIFGEVAGNA
jgi:hypothetical protein